MADFEPGAYRFIKTLLIPLITVSTKRSWRGGEHVPREGAVIIAPNHTSYFDVFAVGHFIIEIGRAHV